MEGRAGLVRRYLGSFVCAVVIVTTGENLDTENLPVFDHRLSCIEAKLFVVQGDGRVTKGKSGIL